jgi:TolB-like protein
LLLGENDLMDGASVESQTLPTDADILAQLDRIRSSKEFDVPDRARKFLTYVIGEALAGRANRIKAYSIAVEVYGRDGSFDAQMDPVVRIQAGLIRRGLEHYYLVAGQDDPVVVTLPKGGYVPVFSRRNEATPPPAESFAATPPKRFAAVWGRAPPRMWLAFAVAAFMGLAAGGYMLRSGWPDNVSDTSSQSIEQAGPDVPRLVIEPFEDLSGTQDSAIIAQGLTDEVVGQLAKFKEIVVVAGNPPGGSSKLLAAGDSQAPFALEGRIRVHGEKLRLSARLINRTHGSVVWTNNYDSIVQVHDLLQLEADIARAVATALAQPYGIIFQMDAAQLAQSPPDDMEAYTCTLAYYRYRANLNPQMHASVQSCLQRAVERFPSYATAWALLSLTYLDELRFRYRLNSTPPSLDLATDAAGRAVELDPQNVRALQAEMLSYFFRGDIAAALDVGARAYSLNPNDTELSGEYGFRLALSGEWKPGCKLIASAVSRNPEPSGYFESALAVCAYIDKDYITAERWARSADVRFNPIYHVILTAILGQLGKTEEARIERQWLETHASTFLENIRNEVAVRLLRREDQLHFIEGLKQAGLSIPDE